CARYGIATGYFDYW
nr:immunoglobulin heavy chain junction region [Macaca mulatta]MOY21579.1 immunoglobulin heavy chain junction region [Macaca mulatta]MOY21904.1 immunoglobulin heavy chain junction region [Macaca mulatta]MOY22127.1 immunoglobulin heavy chain junction region [Macaca mulatta]MOY22499.1 immunoglobulin heavy chain junction region [Macaca mulatta]